MTTTAALETINREQLATATDRLLLRGRLQQRSGARSVSPRACGTWTAIPEPAVLARGSEPCIARAEGSQPRIHLADGSQYITPLANGAQPGVTAALRNVHPAPPVRRPQPLATYRQAQPTACTPAQPVACTPAQPTPAPRTTCAPAQPTMVMRRRGAVHAQMLAVTIGIPLVGLAIGLAALL